MRTILSPTIPTFRLFLKKISKMCLNAPGNNNQAKMVHMKDQNRIKRERWTFQFLEDRTDDEGRIHAGRSNYQTTWLKCYPWKQDFFYSYKYLPGRKVLFKKKKEVVMGIVKTALCSWDEKNWEWMRFHLCGHRKVFSFYSWIFRAADLIPEQGAKVAVIMSICPRYSAPEMSHLPVQGHINHSYLGWHASFGSSIDACHLHPRYLRCVGLLLQANEGSLQQTACSWVCGVWSALCFMKDGNCPSVFIVISVGFFAF